MKQSELRQQGPGVALRRRPLLVGAAAACVLGFARAQEAWVPSRPLRLIVTAPAGGGGDTTARAYIEPLGHKLGQPVIVDNRAGAGGMIGAEAAYRAPPDGYTLLWGNADILTMAPHLYRKMRYKPLDFVPIGPTAAVPFVLLGRRDLPARTFPELLDLARRTELSFATWGNGSIGHVGAELFKARAKVPKVLVVPFQGTAPAAQALLAGQVDLMYMPAPLFLAMQSSLTTFAAAGTHRYELFKQVPTLQEFDVAIDLEAWQGLFAPPQTPRPVIDRISRALIEVSNDPAQKKRIDELGLVLHNSSQEDFARSLPKDFARWGEIMRLAQVQPQD